VSVFGTGKITATNPRVPQIYLFIHNGPSQETFEAASAKAYAGAQGIKHFFAVIQPKNLSGQPSKKMKKNGLFDANMSVVATPIVTHDD
jgi:hypothetical protein